MRTLLTRALLLTGAAGLAIGSIQLSAVAASADDSTDVGIVVTTTAAPGTAAAGTGTGSPDTVGTGGPGSDADSSGFGDGPSGSFGGGSGAGIEGGADGSAGTTAGGEQLPTEAVPGATDVGGGLLVGGVSGTFRPSLNPMAGRIEVVFSVANRSTSEVDASATFSMTNLFGQTVGERVTVPIRDLKAGSSRQVVASLDGVSQWTFLTAHAHFTPPKTVDGVATKAMDRDAAVFAFPWLLFVLLVLAGAAIAIIRLLRRIVTDAPLAPEAA